MPMSNSPSSPPGHAYPSAVATRDDAHVQLRELESRVRELVAERDLLREAARVELAVERHRHNEETFRHLVQNSPFGVYVVDSDFRLQLVSAGSQKVFRNVRPLIGRDFAEVLREIWAEPFASEAIALFRHTLDTGEPFHAPDTTERRHDVEETESYDWKIERIKLPDGQYGVVCHFYDLTERQHYEAVLEEARQRAEEASLAKSRFLAVMSHELRTPLAGVIGFAELLHKEVLGPTNERQREALSRITMSTWHLVSIIDEILALARVEAGKEEVRIEETDLAAITQEVARIIEPQIDASRLRLSLECCDSPAVMQTDPGKVRQILINLVGNAVKFTAQGEVKVRLDRSDPDRMLIHVHDTGPGIESADHDRIFEAFTQVDSSHSRDVAGTGLGLAICRRLARLLGGDVVLDSDPGEGSTFTLVLPGTG
jgi:signal transduction histidine kinase